MDQVSSSRRRIIALASVLASGAIYVFPAASETYPATNEGELARSVENIFNEIRKEFGVAATLSLTDNSVSDSDPNGNVTIGIRWLEGIFKNAEVSASVETIRFVVAHELWHQVQFQDGDSSLFEASETRRVLECEADLAAARYIYRVAGLSVDSHENTMQEFIEAARAVERLAQSVGLPLHSAADHPTQEQRRKAVVFGLSRGIVDQFSSSDFDNEIDYNTYERLRRVLDLANGESDRMWSRRICERIVNFRQEALSGIKVEEPEINFVRDEQNESIQGDVVYFNLPYVNVSNQAVRVSLAVQSVSVPRDDRHNLAESLIVAAGSEVFDLEPGAMHVVSGVMPWFATEELMPALIFSPAQEGALISAEFIGDGVEDPCERDIEDCAQIVDGPDADARALGTVLAQLGRDARNGFTRFRSETRSIRSTSVVFRSSLQLPGSIDTDIRLDRDGSVRVTAYYYEGKSYEDAAAMYSDISAKLRSLYSGRRTPTEWISESDSSREITVSVNRFADVELNLSEYEEDSEYAVYIVIRPVFF